MRAGELITLSLVACGVLLCAPSIRAQEDVAAVNSTAAPDASNVGGAPCPSVDAKSVDAKTDGQGAPPTAKRKDEVWLISTRHLCYPNWDDPQTYELDVRRYDHEQGWLDSSTAEFIAQPPLSTLIYVHGNRVTWHDASQYGWQCYHALAECENAPPSMRFVIWTWPSDQIKGPLRDIRSKADRADNETLFLGWFLSQQNPASPISLLGYSYGSRVITGGVHLFAGGSLCGNALPQPAKAEQVPLRVALLAAALDNDWLCAGHHHGMAMEQVSQMLVLYNTCDPALQRYRFVDPCSHAQALGYVGVADESLGAYAPRIEQLNVSSIVGRSHGEDNYFRQSGLRLDVCRVLFHPASPSDGG